jgi:hypothetical protein
MQRLLFRIGGGMIGYALPTTNNPKFDVLTAGLGLTVLTAAIAFNSKYRTHMRKTIDVFNGNMAKEEAHLRKTSMFFSGTTLCFKLSF